MKNVIPTVFTLQLQLPWLSCVVELNGMRCGLIDLWPFARGRHHRRCVVSDLSRPLYSDNAVFFSLGHSQLSSLLLLQWMHLLDIQTVFVIDFQRLGNAGPAAMLGNKEKKHLQCQAVSDKVPSQSKKTESVPVQVKGCYRKGCEIWISFCRNLKVWRPSTVPHWDVQLFPDNCWSLLARVAMLSDVLLFHFTFEVKFDNNCKKLWAYIDQLGLLLLNLNHLGSTIYSLSSQRAALVLTPMWDV